MSKSGRGERRGAREAALQTLYKIDLNKGDIERALRDVAEGLGIDDDGRRYADRILYGIRDNAEEIDELISSASEHWSLDRMGVVDRGVLRVAVYELLYSDDVPYKVAIDEAVEIAKLYGTDESGGFINGVLDSVAKSRGLKKG